MEPPAPPTAAPASKEAIVVTPSRRPAASQTLSWDRCLNYAGRAVGVLAHNGVYSLALYGTTQTKVIALALNFLVAPLLTYYVGPQALSLLKRAKPIVDKIEENIKNPEHLPVRKLPSLPSPLSLVFKSVVLGYSNGLTLGSVLTFPFISNPDVYIAKKLKEKGWEFKRIQINANALVEYPEHRTTLKVLICLDQMKKNLHLNTAYIFSCLALSAIYGRLCPSMRANFKNLYPLSLVPLGILGVGTTIKYISWKRGEKDLDFIVYKLRTEAAFGEISSRGDFSYLPAHLIQYAGQFLSTRDYARLSMTSRFFRFACNTLEKEKRIISEHYHPELIKAFGLARLAALPVLDLKATAVEPLPLTTDEDWERLAKWVRYDNETFPLIDDKFLSSCSAESSIFIKNTGEARLDHAFRNLPCITRGSDNGHPLIYSIEAAEMGSHRIMRFEDPLGRWGLALQTECRYRSSYGLNKMLHGVIIIHQLNPQRLMGIWALVRAFDLDVHLRGNRYVISQSEYITAFDKTICRKWKMLLHTVQNQAGPDCDGNMRWLQKLASGLTCGWLIYGKEYNRRDLPQLTLKAKDENHTLSNKIKFFAQSVMRFLD